MGTADLLIRYIPIELVGEILSWSPVTSICRFTCVCKSWYALINNPYFITTHTRRRRCSGNNTPPALLLRCAEWGRVGEKPDDSCDPSKLTLYDLTTFGKHLEIDNPFYKDTFVGSSGGLICLSIRCRDWPYYRNDGDELCLWNPIIHRFKAVPNSSSSIYNMINDFLKLKIEIRHHMVVGFGFHEQADDYKIVRIAYFSGDKVPPPAVEVYSLRRDSWTTVVEAKVPSSFTAFPIRSVNGAIYWGAWKPDSTNVEDKFFMSFDFNQEEFQIIQPPPPTFPLITCTAMDMLPTVINKDGSFNNSELAIGTLDGLSWDIWMAPKYEKKQGISTNIWTWSKKFRINLNKNPLILLRGIIGDEKVLYSTEECDHFLVDVETQRRREVIGLDIHLSKRDLGFMESLALLDLGPAHLPPLPPADSNFSIPLLASWLKSCQIASRSK